MSPRDRGTGGRRRWSSPGTPEPKSAASKPSPRLRARSICHSGRSRAALRTRRRTGRPRLLPRAVCGAPIECDSPASPGTERFSSPISGVPISSWPARPLGVAALGRPRLRARRPRVVPAAAALARGVGTDTGEPLAPTWRMKRSTSVKVIDHGPMTCGCMVTSGCPVRSRDRDSRIHRARSPRSRRAARWLA